MDERNRTIANRVMSVMYLITILAMLGIVIYRKAVLGQSYKDFEDIAIVMTVNSLFVVAWLCSSSLFLPGSENEKWRRNWKDDGRV